MRISCVLLLCSCLTALAEADSWECSFVTAGRAVAEKRYADAEGIYRSMLHGWKPQAEPDSRQADTLHALAVLYTLEARYREAEPLCRRALAIRETVPVLLPLGTIARVQGRYAEAEQWTRRAIGLAENTNSDAAELGTAYSNLALDLIAQHDYRQAQEVVTIALRTGAGPQALSLLAQLYASNHQFRESEQYQLKVIHFLERGGGSMNSALVPELTNLASTYAAEKRYRDAEDASRRALSIAAAQLGESHGDWANAALVLAETLAAEKRFAEAEQYFERLLPVLERLLGATNGSYGRALRAYAALLRKTHRTSEAQSMDARASAILAMQNRTVSITELKRR